jgi:predicted O-linked N-acetylglucosamine transferase (SPINDLY family)
VNLIIAKINQDEISVPEIMAAADSFMAKGDPQAARHAYTAWLARNSADPMAYAIYFNLSVVLGRLRDAPAAKIALERAIALNPDYIPAQINLGNLLEQLQGPFEAACQWIGVVNRFPQITGENIHFLTFTLNLIGRVLETGRSHAQAEESFRRSLDIDIDQPEIMQHYLSVVQQQCKWPVIQPWPSARGVTRRDLLANINPLTLAIYTDDPLFQLGNSFHYARQRIGDCPISYVDSHAPLQQRPAGRLRIGYLSAELRNHAGGFLMAEVFELHDKSKVEIFIYNTVAAPPEGMAGRIRSAAEHSVDIADLSDSQAAQRIVDDGIQVLVDMQGHTYGSRLGLLAMRPAPVIANWLGFPGSVGTSFHNYIIADDFIIPPEFEIYYSEKIARLPCYQPNDRKRLVADHCPTRHEAGLPETAMVYCAFNGQHKITPYTWRRWMSILRAVEGSVLWLLESTEAINGQLRRLAENHGVAAERIIFAKRIGNADHLARYRLADLFLDTAPYGAHTTASDAMWMGVPIITLVGRSFASRVCGSIMRSAGLPDLICSSGEDYVAMAIDLGLNRDKLIAYRQRLVSARDSSVLFDTPLLVRCLEQLFTTMWRDYVQGEQFPPDLTNLDLYREVGIALDQDDVEMLSQPDYEERVRQTFIQKSRYCFVPKDGRIFK